MKKLKFLEKHDFLVAAEIHYFRIEKKYWENVIDRAIEVGCNVISFYTPWIVHEYENDKFDFLGKKDSKYDLISWVKLIEKKGLKIFLRPGPYCYAEMKNLGIPDWLVKKYPEELIEGLNFAFAHNNPIFKKYTLRWYDEVLNAMKPFVKNKTIELIQICNEIPGQDIGDINKLKTEAEKRIFLQEYYNEYFPNYFKELIDKIIEVYKNVGDYDLLHNAYNPRAISLHYENSKINENLIIGVDNYYSLTGNLKVDDLYYYCSFGAGYLKSHMKTTPIVIEHEVGYWHDNPVVHPKELYLFLIWTMMSGYKGLNMYLFSGGKNNFDLGFHGTDHNWQAPVNLEGEVNEKFTAIKLAINEYINNKKIFEQEQEYDIGFSFPNNPGMIWEDISKQIVNSFSLLKHSGYSPKVIDIDDIDEDELLILKKLWFVSDVILSEVTQKKLLKFVENGGILFLQNKIPTQNEKNEKCQIILETINAEATVNFIGEGWENKLFHTPIEEEVHVGEKIQEIKYNTPPISIGSAKDKMPIVTEHKIKNGKLVILPFEMSYRTNSQKRYIDYLMSSNNIEKRYETQYFEIIFKKIDGKEFCIVLNPHPYSYSEECKIYGNNIHISLEGMSYKIIELGNI